MDDPCWGGLEPNRHNLPSLLLHLREKRSNRSLSFSFPEHKRATTMMTSTSTLLSAATATIVVCKTDNRCYLDLKISPDLCMDGPNPTTFHKLLCTLYQCPSLLDHMSAANDSVSAASAPNGYRRDNGASASANNINDLDCTDNHDD